MSDHPVLYRDRPVVVGAGLAGLMTALCLAPEPVVLLSRAPLGAETSTAWAQGGLAASLAADDTPAMHLADTVEAGAGLVEAEAARRIVTAAPGAVRRLAAFGVRFDAADGAFLLGLEAAHGRRRIVHADGDATGREIVRALAAAVRATPSITVLEGVEARRLIVEDGAIAGIVCVGPKDETMTIPTARVVLATGGIGGLFCDSTNPRASQGQGLALAARAGAMLSNLEFVQFHPTALDTAARPMGLVSEAVRGEGAVLVDETGERFLRHLPGAELAPRDEVARGIWRHLAEGHRVYLDARQQPGAGFARRFPGIDRLCREAGFDPTSQPLPVRPAQHYHMGGIAVDGQGRSSVPGLWACGEVACTGLHGANRLASNSLAEAAVCAAWVAESVGSAPGTSSRFGRAAIAAPAADLRASDPAPTRQILSRALGVIRVRAGLEAAIAELLPLAAGTRPASNPALVGLMLAVSALARQESRGAHWRADFPSSLPMAAPSFLSLGQALALARETLASLPFAESA
ncbi:L-aspartate oxidase [Labrys sp. LIt4]|uniref:L-aspartate oxidase n=1 Tax=Labrys sp. LIt4 TaxID=2821355 RepID=UPI001ADF72FE|nr:L-aspartate oxidase [Labrys sp. LIt4]MBP0583253.1 L-aspartate oxidase [Labrys sp. LIt4]